MIRYAPMFEGVRALARTWHASDFDAHTELVDPLVGIPPDQVAEFVEEFCGRAGDHVAECGADEIGGLIWYVLGSGTGVWHDVVKASREHAQNAVGALRHLYEGCFARHLSAWSQGGSGGSLSSACYMLWDMDGGLETIPLCGVPKHLVSACYEALEHALSLESPACWESALHGLGHVVFNHEQPAQGLIDAFLESRRGRLPDHVVLYARSARTGCVQ